MVLNTGIQISSNLFNTDPSFQFHALACHSHIVIARLSISRNIDRYNSRQFNLRLANDQSRNLDIRNHIIALSVMTVITVVNIGLATNLIFSGGSAVASALNSQNVFVLAALQLTLVMVAYVTTKQQRLPTLP